MSLLFGVRSSNQKNDGQSFRDNIIQQPGSFYNSNPSSSIWGNPPSQPLWCERSLADDISSSSSSTAVPLMFSSSSELKSSIGTAEEKQRQHSYPMKSGEATEEDKQEGSNPLRAVGYGYRQANVQQNGKLSSLHRTSDPSSSPFTFGYLSQSGSFGSDRSNSFRFMAKESSRDFLSDGKPSLDEGGRQADLGTNANPKNEKSWKFGAVSDNFGSKSFLQSSTAPEVDSSLRSSFLNSSAVQQKSNSGVKTWPLENEFVSGSGSDGKKSMFSDNLESSGISDSGHTSHEKKTPEVFVFGASGSGGTSFKSSVLQQKSFQGSFTASSSRSRTSKFKRHSNVVKGKGLAPLGGICIQQFVPVFSRDASPQSNAGIDSAAESSHLDEAECSDAGIWPEDNIDGSIDFEADDFLQSDCMPEGKAGVVAQDEGLSLAQEGRLSTDEGSFFHDSSTMQDHASLNQEPQEEYLSDTQETHVSNWQSLGERFVSWWPFQKKVGGDSRDNWEASGSLKATMGEYTTAHSVDAVTEPRAAVEQADFGDVTFGKVPETGLQSRLGTFAEVAKPLEGRSSKISFAGGAFVVEPTQNTGGYAGDSTWNVGGNDFRKPFVFGVSQKSQVQADDINEGVLRGSGTAATSKCSKDEKMQEDGKSLTSGSSAPSPSFSVGTNFSTPFNKRPANTLSSVFTTSEPVTNIIHNLDFVKEAHSSFFTEHDNEGPTGEFSGPLSPSGSSTSEGSPSKGEPWSASDKPFNQTQCFEFQGSVRDGSTRMATGKKKSKTTTRRQGRGTNRGRRVAQSTSFKNTVTPMDFSPSAIDTESSLGGTTLEQPYYNFNGAKDMDDREFLRQLSEIQNMNEFTAAAARLSIGTDRNISDFEIGKQTSEGPTDWAYHNLSSKRSGKWKRRGLDEGSSDYQENRGLAEHSEREDMSGTYDYTLKQEDNNFEQPFTFGASSYTSSSSTPHRYAQRPQKENPMETCEGSTSELLTACRPDGSGSADQDRQSQAKLGSGLFFPVVPSGVLRPSTLINNQNQSDVRNTEQPASPSGHQFVQGSPNAVKSAAAEQVCETWRLRGNQAYANGDFPKAEEYYSRGASSVSPDETSQSCIRASMLCYSNRAATRMAVGRMREALADCKRAMVVDPGFLRVRLRAASCHLALGESKAAADVFKECIKYAKESVKPDSKILAEALEGVKKSQQLDEYYDRARELLQKQTLMDSTSSLRILDEALSISSFSEPLHELKAQVLLSLRRYEDCLLFCDQTLPAAERNHGSAVHEKHQDLNGMEARQSHENNHLKLWRSRLSAKALYHLGKLEDALDLLVKHEEVLSASSTDKATNSESLAPFLASIRYMLRHKAAGNEAFQLGKHAEAVEHYTAALACNGDSRPFNAVCFCNRAAASQALGHIADAIADCSRAIALDTAYPKALSRRATLHEMIRDFGQACNDLRRLIGLLEDYQANSKNNQGTKGLSANINAQDLRQARERLEKGEEEMKKGHPIDHYLVLGVDFSCSVNEIKKAYRKAALKHHPDKAGQFLARNENGDDGGIWKEVGDEVRRDAERLFKLIGEAYAILSDPTKRLRYDMDEENRKLRGKDSSNQVSSSTSEGYRSQYEKSGRRQRDRWDAWQGYAPQHQRWQSGPDAAQPDTYGRRNMFGADPAKTGKTTWNTDFSWDKL